ncbi:MAG: hypothetical protein LUE13_11345 [Akkermansiaceae bacterium]|nr:hypothetical protein [Akkermansiaceae bacterium]
MVDDTSPETLRTGLNIPAFPKKRAAQQKQPAFSRARNIDFPLPYSINGLGILKKRPPCIWKNRFPAME